MFDAELYLRLIGERSLAEGSNQQHHGPTPLSSAAQALVVAGVIEPATARGVLSDYLLARGLRGDQMAMWVIESEHEDEERMPALEPLTPPRAVTCDREIETPTGTTRVHLVSLSERETVVAVTLRFASTSPRMRHGRSGILYGGRSPGLVTLADDRGTKRQAHFSGGGGEHQWTGHFTAQPGLATDTAYIELDGERIDLLGEVPAAEVWIEDLPDPDPVLQHLWAGLTQDDLHEETPLEPAIEALVAAGVLADDHPELADIRAVASARQGVVYHGSSREAKKLPEPWRSIYAPSRRKGPTGTIAVNAATPLFDGTSVAATSLKSDEHGWELSVEVAPDHSVSPFRMGLDDSAGLTWWARDERGHQFLGAVAGWNGGDGTRRGEIVFEGGLDRKSTYVDVMPTAPTQRAVIRIPLEWSK
ncbi:hypothetical protein [Solirubrobacter soli]|uniref:hypothetical protein n=1 Tax=Solirubrobacter soli TaxID=363832 RepID=UPI0003F535E5|nr:hypothetical protein [Solirubrobacter soli]